MGKCDMSSPSFSIHGMRSLSQVGAQVKILATEMSASGPSNEVSRMASLSVNFEWLFRSTEVWTGHVFCIRGWRVLVTFWIWCRLSGQFLQWPFHPFLLNLPVQNATHWDKCRTCIGSKVAVSCHVECYSNLMLHEALPSPAGKESSTISTTFRAIQSTGKGQHFW